MGMYKGRGLAFCNKATREARVKAIDSYSAVGRKRSRPNLGITRWSISYSKPKRDINEGID